MNFKSEKEGIWKEVLKVNFTDEELDTLKNGTKEEVDFILSKTFRDLTEEEFRAVTDLYNHHKPELQDGEEFELIVSIITFEQGKKPRGFINFWKHKSGEKKRQIIIRF